MGFLPIEKVHRDAKVISHALEPHDAIALQQLLIRAQPHLAHEPPAVLVQVAVLREEVLLDGRERAKERAVAARVQAADQLRQRCEVDRGLGVGVVGGGGAERRQVDGCLGVRGRVGHVGVAVGPGAGGERAGERGELIFAFAQDGFDFGGVDDLGLEVDALEGYGAGEDGVYDEVGVGAQLVAGEGGEAVEEKRRGLVVVANCEEVQTFVGLQAVAAIPVTTALDQGRCSLDLLLDEDLVAVEEPKADDREDQVDLCAQNARLFEYCFVARDCLVLDEMVSILSYPLLS